MLLTSKEKNILAEENMKLVYFVVNKFVNTGISREELTSIGLVGYTKALNTYNTEKKAKFSTYAVTCIKNEILYFLRKEKKHRDNSILSGNLINEDDEGNLLSLEDILTNEMNDEISIENATLLKEDIEILRDAIKKLSERDQFIIINRFGLNGGKILTQTKVGERLGMSQANVSKLENNIVKRLFFFLNNKIKIEDNDFYFDLEFEEEKKEKKDIEKKF